LPESNRRPGLAACDALADTEYLVTGSGVGSDYTAALLEWLGGRVVRSPSGGDPHPAIEWARSGAMALTGQADGPPLLAPGPLASCARATVDAIRLVAGDRWPPDLDGAALLGERAAILGLRRRGSTSPGGSCRILEAADGWIAISLPRPDDLRLLPAWLGEGEVVEPWEFVATRVAWHPAADIVARARLLGLAAAVAAGPTATVPPWCRIAARGRPLSRVRSDPPLVIDLSSLWAGPLCTHLLELAGARVVKLESTRRPDGARSGPPQFHALLNAGKASVALDFGDPGARSKLHRILEHADIVVESSRPRALAQLGVDAESLMKSVPGLTWVSLTGYGRREPGSAWVAFGDDAGVAAGLAVATAGGSGPPLFCGDAIADPLSGLHAALAALACWRAGGGYLLDLALCEVASHVLAFGPAPSPASVRRTASGWEVVTSQRRAAVAPPRARPVRRSARSLGADTERVLAELAIPC
jgi:crotonobetainyl-CoA:carnitine CoA-transferase CaiB-like acyl-CoA transferase